MAKILAPPAITNLDGLLDLLLHPDKYIAYMQQLQAMKDSILVSLDHLATKDQAEAYLAQATTRLQDAQRLVTEAHDTVQTAQQQADRIRGEAHAHAAGVEEDLKTRQHTLVERERAS